MSYTTCSHPMKKSHILKPGLSALFCAIFILAAPPALMAASVSIGAGETKSLADILRGEPSLDFGDFAFAGAAQADPADIDALLMIDSDISFDALAMGADQRLSLNGYAGAISLNGGDLVVSGNSGGSQGGALYLDDAQLRIESANGHSFSFAGNSAANGGAVFMQDSTLDLGGSVQFTDNTADDFGGALSMRDSELTISGDVYFTGNSTAGNDAHGGALYMENSLLTISGNAWFAGNTTTGNDAFGGALYMQDSELTISGTARFSGNATTGNDAHGGALFVNNSPLTISGYALFMANNAENANGGALYMQNSELTISGGALFTGNSAYYGNGGALYLYNSGGTALEHLLVNTSFTGNSTFNDGGAIYLDGSHILTLQATGGQTSLFADNENALYFNGGGTLNIGSANIDADNGGIVDMRDYITSTGDSFTLNINENATLKLGGGNTFTVDEDGQRISLNIGANATLHLYRQGEVGRSGAVPVGDITYIFLDTAESADSSFNVNTGAVLSIGGGNTIDLDGGSLYIADRATLRFDAAHANISTSGGDPMLMWGNVGAVDIGTGGTVDLLSLPVLGGKYVLMDTFGAETKDYELTLRGEAMDAIVAAGRLAADQATLTTDIFFDRDLHLAMSNAITSEALVWNAADDANVWNATAAHNWVTYQSALSEPLILEDLPFLHGDIVNFNGGGAKTVVIQRGGVQAVDMAFSGSESYSFSGGGITVSLSGSSLGAYTGGPPAEAAGVLRLGGYNTGGIGDGKIIENAGFTGVVDLTGITGENYFEKGIELYQGTLRINKLSQLGGGMEGGLLQVQFVDGGLGATLEITADIIFDGFAGINHMHVDHSASSSTNAISLKNAAMTAHNNIASEANGSVLELELNGGSFELKADENSLYVFENNSVSGSTPTLGHGGVIAYINSGTGGGLSITNAVFRGNQASKTGGAIYVNGGELNLTDVDMLDNKGHDGAVVAHATSENPVVVNVTVTAGHTSTISGNIDSNDDPVSGIYINGGSANQALLNINTAAGALLDMRDAFFLSSGAEKAVATKSGAGTWYLGGTSIINGGPDIDEGGHLDVQTGTLRLLESARIRFDSDGSLSVGAGAALQFMGGNRISNSVAINDFSVILADGAVLGFNLAAANAYVGSGIDTPLVIFSNLDQINFDGAVQVDMLSLNSALGTYALAEFNLAVDLGDFESDVTLRGQSLAGTRAEGLFTLDIKDGAGTDSMLVVTQNTAGTNPATDIMVGVLNIVNTWTGAANGAWDIQTANWQGGGLFWDGDVVNFTGTGANTTGISIAGGGSGIITVAGMYLSGNKNYAISNGSITTNAASGTLTGAAAGGKLVLGATAVNATTVTHTAFTGTLDLTGTVSNTFTSGVEIYTGALKIKTAAQLGALSGLKLLGGTTDFTALGDAVLNGGNVLTALATARTGGLPNLIIADSVNPVTFSNAGTLAVANAAGSVHLADGTAAVFTGYANDAVISVSDGILVMSAGDGARYQFTKNSSVGVNGNIEISGDSRFYLEKADFDNTGRTAADNNFLDITGDNADPAYVVLNDVTFSNNASGTQQGGAVSIQNAVVSVTRAEFSGNSSEGQGGAVYLGDSQLTLNADTGKNVLFSNNIQDAAGTPEANSIYISATNMGQDVKLTINAANTGVVDMQGPLAAEINGGGTDMGVTVAKTGAGVWKLGGTSVFEAVDTGHDYTAMSIYTGTLHLYGAGNNGNIELQGAQSSFTLANGATLEAGGENAIRVNDGSITLQSGGILKTAASSETTLTLSTTGSVKIGAIEINAATAGSLFNVDAGFADINSVTDKGGITKTGAGTVVLLGNSAYTGATTVSAGTLVGSGSGALSQNSVFEVAAGATLAASNAAQTIGGLKGAGTVTLNHNLTVNQASDTAFSGKITGNGNFIKTGAGTLTLSGAGHTHTGATIVNGGALKAGAAGAFSFTSSDFSVGGTSTLDLANHAQTIKALAVSSGGQVVLGSATLTIDDGGSAASTDVGGVISGTGGLSLTGGNVLRFNDQASTYSGATYIGANAEIRGANVNALSAGSAFTVDGGLVLSASQAIGGLSGVGGVAFNTGGLTLTVNQSADSTYSGAWSFVSNATLAKTGGGALTLKDSAANMDGRLAYNITGGVLRLQSSGSLPVTLNNALSGAGTLALDVGGNINMAAGINNGFTGKLLVEQGSLLLDANSDALLANAALQLSGAGAWAYLENDRSANAFIMDGGVLAFDVPGEVLTLHKLSVADLTVTGAGGMVAVSITDDIHIDTMTGSLQIFADNAGAAQAVLVSATGSVIGAGQQLAVVDVNGDEIETPHTRELFDGVDNIGKASFSYMATVMDAAGQKGLYLGYGLTMLEIYEGYVRTVDTDDAASSSPVLNAELTGAGGLHITGSNDLAIGNVNSDYTGATTIDGTDVTMIANNAFGDTGKLELSNNASVDMNGMTQTVGALNGEAGTTIILGGLEITDGGTFSGELTGSDANASLHLSGGTLNLSNANNDYSGKTVVTGGTLNANAADALSANSALELNGGTTQLGGATQTIAGLSGTGGVLDTGAATLTVNQDENGTFAGALQGAGTLVKDKDANLTLKDIGDYTGAFDIQDGSLTIQQNAGLLLGNQVSGPGTLAIDLGAAANELKFADNLSGFDGIMQMLKGTVALDDNAEAFLRDALVEILAGGTLEVVKDAGLGNLTLDGGALKISNGALTLQDLDITGNGGTLAVSIPDNINTDAPGAANFFDYAATAGHQQKVVDVTGNITGSGSLLNLTDADGNPLDTSAVQQQIIQGGVAVGQISLGLTGVVGTDGIYVGHGLTAVEAFDGETMTLDSAGANSANPLLNAALTGAGGFVFSGGQQVQVGNAASDYTGATQIADGTTVQASSNNVLGNTSLLGLGSGSAFDLGGYTQTLGGLAGQANSMIAIGSAGALTLNADQMHTYAGKLSGSGILALNGGGLNLTGDNSAFDGTVNLGGGKLYVNGDLGSSSSLSTIVNVGSGALLGGGGTIYGNVVNSGGTVSPGNSIGTITIAGNYTGTGVLEVEVDPANDASADLLIVTGTANLAGTVVRHIGLDESAGLYSTDEMQWRILTAGNIASEFDGVETLPEYWYLNLELVYDSAMQWVDLVISNNMMAYASTGEVHPGLTGSLQNYDRAFARALSSRVMTKDFAETGYPLWVTFDGHSADTQSTNTTGKTRFYGAGITLGTEGNLTDDIILGAAFRYGSNTFKLDRHDSSADIESYSLSLYGGWDIAVSQMTKLRLALGGSYGIHDIETSRGFTAGASSQHLKADYDARSVQFFGEAGLSFNLTDGFKMEPYAGVAWTSVHTDSFREKGGNAALSGKSRTDDNLSSSLGVRVEYRPDNSESFALYGDVSWQHVYGDVDPDAKLNFAGGTPFVLEGAPMARDAAVVSVGGEMKLTESLKMTGGYEGVIGSGYQSHGGKLSLVFSF